MTLTKILFVFSLLFISLNSVSAQTEDSEYTKTLKKMFEVAGSEETYQSVLKQMIGLFKGNYSNLDDKFWDEIEKEFLKTSMDDLTEMLVPVYKKHLTINDLKEIITFYETPTGKKYAKKTPQISEESMEVGQKWGAMIGEKIAKKIADEKE